MIRAPVRRLRDWLQRRRGRRSRILDLLGGPGDDVGGAGVREPRRPRTPSLSGAAAVDLPDEQDEAAR